MAQSNAGSSMPFAIGSSKKTQQLGIVPWEITIPATFFAAAAACMYDPTMAPSITFIMIGCALCCYKSVMSYFTKPASEGLTSAMTDSMILFAQSEEQTDRLLDALAVSLERALQSSSLQGIVKKSFMEILSDDELQEATIQTLQKAMKKASENQEFQDTCFDVVKRAFVGALNNESFISESINSGVSAMVTASQDAILRQNVLSVVTQGVSSALNDDEFLEEIKNVIKACLEDEDFFRSGAKGILKAANPFGGRSTSKAESDKSDSKHGSTKQLTTEKL